MRKIIVYDSVMEIYEIVKNALQHISIDIECTSHFSRILHQIELKSCAAMIFNLDKTPEGELDASIILSSPANIFFVENILLH